MTLSVVDLTAGDSSDVEADKKMATRPASIATTDLFEAIDTISLPRLRGILKDVCATDERLTEILSGYMLVPPKQSGLVQCENCDNDFDPAKNEDGDCVFHDGEKDMDDTSSIWADYDEDRDGPMDELIDDPDFARGFCWNCCEGAGDSEGCMKMKHRAPLSSTAPVESKKRKEMEQERVRPRFAMCANCEEEFDVTVNKMGDCVWHADYKSVDYDSDFWADHDEDCHGRMEDFKDDPDYGEGFLWQCCEKSGNAKGCQRTKHVAKEVTNKRARY